MSIISNVLKLGLCYKLSVEFIFKKKISKFSRFLPCSKSVCSSAEDVACL